MNWIVKGVAVVEPLNATIQLTTVERPPQTGRVSLDGTNYSYNLYYWDGANKLATLKLLARPAQLALRGRPEMVYMCDVIVMGNLGRAA